MSHHDRMTCRIHHTNVVFLSSRFVADMENICDTIRNHRNFFLPCNKQVQAPMVRSQPLKSSTYMNSHMYLQNLFPLDYTFALETLEFRAVQVKLSVISECFVIVKYNSAIVTIERRLHARQLTVCYNVHLFDEKQEFRVLSTHIIPPELLSPSGCVEE